MYTLWRGEGELTDNEIKGNIENTDCETNIFGQFDSPVEPSQ